MAIEALFQRLLEYVEQFIEKISNEDVHVVILQPTLIPVKLWRSQTRSMTG